MAPRQKKAEPKRVVYLWGAGATQGEVTFRGAETLNVLMRDNGQLGEGIATRILKRLGTTRIPLDEPDVDIEKLISLLSASGTSRHIAVADKMRQQYFQQIRNGLAAAKIISDPRLAIGLLQMHQDAAFREIELLSGIITTNHDGLLQVASQTVLGGINIGFPFAPDPFKAKDDAPIILQLHGSFTWTQGVPIGVSALHKTSKYSDDTVWIPPTILKESKSFPFNKLFGMAYELLANKCDILRVVGASLTQNDWNILSLIFNAQRHLEANRKVPFQIQLIMGHEAGKSVRKACSYFRHVVPIGNLTDGDFSDYQDEDKLPADSDLRNPLAYWLKQRIFHHRGRRELGLGGGLSRTMSEILGEATT
jgi:hypothetical protein